MVRQCPTQLIPDVKFTIRDQFAIALAAHLVSLVLRKRFAGRGGDQDQTLCWNGNHVFNVRPDAEPLRNLRSTALSIAASVDADVIVSVSCFTLDRWFNKGRFVHGIGRIPNVA